MINGIVLYCHSNKSFKKWTWHDYQLGHLINTSNLALFLNRKCYSPCFHPTSTTKVMIVSKYGSLIVCQRSKSTILGHDQMNLNKFRHFIARTLMTVRLGTNWKILIGKILVIKLDFTLGSDFKVEKPVTYLELFLS